MKKKTHFINNKDFYAAIVKYYGECEEKNEVLPIPKYLIQCIVELVTRVGHKKNFRYYTYLNDMKQEAIISCMLAMKKRMFNIEYNNPFAYFTSCCFYSFLGTIKKENKQVDIQEKLYTVDRDNLSSLSGDEKDDEVIRNFMDNYFLRFKSYDAKSNKEQEELSGPCKTYQLP